jgi:hypothetical protein
MVACDVQLALAMAPFTAYPISCIWAASEKGNRLRLSAGGVPFFEQEGAENTEVRTRL